VPKRTRCRLLAASAITLLLATACGAEDSPPASGTPPEAPATAPDTAAASPQPTTSDTPDTAPAAPAPDEAAEVAEAPPDGAAEPAVAPGPPPGEPPPPPETATAPDPTSGPVYGGTLLFGVEAETPDGWNPTNTQCTASCHTVMRAIFDPLTITDAAGTPQPYLLEAFESNEDHTVWTFRMRPGITFHDGTPADAHALAIHFENLTSTALAGQILQRVESWEVIDDLTLRLTAAVPFAGLPGGLTGQLGYLAAPSQYADPDGSANPVGTGPFKFISWIPDGELVVERNPDYWKADAGGGALPYLDRIVFRPILDASSRRVALDLGDIQVTHSDDGLEFEGYKENFKTVEEHSFLQTRHLLLNNAQPPFDDIRARQALAHCTDHETFNLLRTGDAFEIANGPFSPNTPGHLADTGFPTYDPEAGQALWAQVPDPGTIRLGTSGDPIDRTSAELLAQMWSACGLDVQIDQIDPGALIRNAIMGNFQVNIFRNHDGISLASERVWWHSRYTSGLALNLGRIRNDKLDEALDRAAGTTDGDELRRIAEDVNRILAEGVHNVWLHWVRWLLPHRAEVQNLARITLPDGNELVNILRGRAFLTETWLN
jgi:peptide/nickel transport system substrate-binding protein